MEGEAGEAASDDIGTYDMCPQTPSEIRSLILKNPHSPQRVLLELTAENFHPSVTRKTTGARNR